MPPPSNGLELSCPAEAGRLPMIVAQADGPGAPPYPPARRVSFSELIGCRRVSAMGAVCGGTSPGRALRSRIGRA